MSAIPQIAFLCHPYHRGGVTRWMADAAIAVAREGGEVWFVTVKPSAPFVSAGGREPMVDMVNGHKGVTLVSEPAGWSFELGTEEHRSAVYARLAQANVPKGVPIILSDDMAVWAAAASIASTYPIIGVLHGDQDYYYDRARKYHQQLAACICVSNRIQRNLLAKCSDIDPKKIYVAPCGIDLPPLRPQQESKEVLRLLFVGRLTDYEKRAYDLVPIAEAIKSQGIQFQLDIVGNDATSAAEYGSRFAASGTGENIVFHGWQSKEAIQLLLYQADVVLLTSNSEGMPIIMMEALASGCGFAGTRVSGIEDYEHDLSAADCIAVYTIGDIADAADKIRSLAAKPITERSSAARALAAREFSMDVCLSRYAKAIAASTTANTSSPIKNSAGGGIYSWLLALARYTKVRLLQR